MDEQGVNDEELAAPGMDDGVVRLRPWADGDAGWYAECSRDPWIQRFTTDPSTLDAAAVLAAIRRMRASDAESAFLVCDAVTGERLGSVALLRDGTSGDVSYWTAAPARGRGVASRALTLFTGWIAATLDLAELRLRAHRDNTASQAVALRAGFHRDPGRDGPMEAKGATWPMLAYARPLTPPRTPAPTPAPDPSP